MQRAALIAVAMLLFSSCSPQRTVGTVGSDSRIEHSVDSLLRLMTLEEKIGQMNQISVGGDVESYAEHIRAGRIGSILNETDPVKVNRYQKMAVEESRLHIPILVGRDVIHGFHTIFPIPLGLASTFDPELVEKTARAAAEEASATGVKWTFSPMCDLSRDSRWGRVAEGSGEDPLLDARMAVALIRGYQTDDPSAPDAIAACVKHFFGYGAAEGGRDYNSTYIPERQMQNFYLPPYKAGVDAGALTVMTSFNDNDGVPSTGNEHLLRDILRKEWGFDGMVVSDWNSTLEMVNHGFAKDDADAARLAANAGCEMDMMSFAYISNLKKLVNDGKVKESDINDAVRDILRVKYKLGLFRNPYVDTTRMKGAYYKNETLALAEKAAEESAVLLKNEGGALPLDASKVRRILVTGPMADAPHDQLGTWAFDGEPSHTVTPLAALKERYGDRMQITYFPALKNSRDDDPAALAQAEALARQCDAVLVFLGEEAILSGEAHSLADISLKGGQSGLLEALKRSGKPIIATIMAGRALCIGKDLDNCDAMLYSFHPGTMGGPALTRLIFGEAVPSGKLPVTFTNVSGEVWYYNHTNTGRPAVGTEVLLKDIPANAGQTSLGNTSFYLDSGRKPLFPFGFGLSYAKFRYSGIKLAGNELTQKDSIKVTASVTNESGPDAVETVQVYVRDLVGSVTRPVKELKAFQRVAVPAGQTVAVAFTIPVSDLAFCGLDMVKKVEPGDFQLWIAGDSDSGEPVSFKVSE
jgi:beta-glucosidase